MKKLIVVVAAVAISTSAMAWGSREQGALAGLIVGAGAVALSQSAQAQPVQPRQWQQPPSVIYTPPQQICGYDVYCGEPQRQYIPTCHMESQVDYYGRVISTYQVCR